MLLRTLQSILKRESLSGKTGRGATRRGRVVPVTLRLEELESRLAPTANLLTNPGAETGDLTGWTIGGPSTAFVDSGSFDPGINPHSGKFDFVGGSGATAGSSGTLTQNVSLVGNQGLTAALIDSGTQVAAVSFFEQGLNQGTPSDNAQVNLTFRDATHTVLSTVSTPVVDSHNGTWQQFTGGFLIPVGTRSIDYTIQFIRHVGTDLDAFVDDTSLIVQNAPQITSITSTTANGTYGVGAPINATVTFNTPVTLAGGNLLINLNDGGTVTITPFANSMTATGIYTVAAGQSANPLDTNSPLVLAAGATLTDAAGNSVSLLIPNGKSLANSSSIVIVTTTPSTQVQDKIGMATAEPNGALGWTLYPTLTSLSSAGSTSFIYGAATDFPVVGDWNGNGSDAVGVVRATPVGGLQWVLDSNDSDAYEFSDSNYFYGVNTDAPVVGDWNGSTSTATKIGVVRSLPSGVAQWTLNTSGTGVYTPGVDQVTTFGLATDKFGAGDWTGTGKDSLAVVRALPDGSLEWVLDTAGTGSYVPSDKVYHFGLATDLPIVGDWNGSGKTEIGVERANPNGTVTFVLDTTGNGIYNASDEVFTVSGSSATLFEFGNWHSFSSMSPTTPVAPNPYAGVYVGMFTGTATGGGSTLPVSGTINSSVDNNGNITITNPGSGSGTVSASTGIAQIGGAGQIGGVQNVSYSFDGTFMLGSGGSATVSGTWSATFTGGSASGTWSGSRQ